ncbi:ribosome biogenesis GTP-binding protein YihA/YsxC [Buchnera aphidicola (Myzus persicae)]|uniref:ribosome biogenesis GTP-binding protein YihA/YsxC n=1 Tax=Buchnera aphidicola TaxID=9 RepID=UPI0024C68D89|nr:MAG: ribosome biogenesis GTP-binding protein YihA/YsxC [Buchnera aphidicola (Myzus persicae)]
MNSLNYNKTKFFKSYSQIDEIEFQNGIEIGFIGYSNSGKSSAINSLTNQKKLARFSKTPGRTQLINFFEVVPGFRIVDLPGYGYANAPVLIKKKWQKRVYNYLEQRQQLRSLVLLMDIRRPLKKLDQKIIHIAIHHKISMLVLLTKCDKLVINEQKIQFKKVYEELKSLSDSFQIELFSAYKKIGIKKLQLKLNHWYDKYFLN